jgi:PAS domain-containing protein
MNAESAVHDMIRAVRPEVEAAGVIGLHVGRRVTGSTSELVVLALWRDRASLRRFAEGRSRGLLDPGFIAQLSRWSFETYDCLSPERLLVPPSGPAVLLVNDERRYVDASSGIEAILGIPGEFLLHRTIDELMPPEDQLAIDAAWASFLAAGAQDGEADLIRPDGVRIHVLYRARAGYPEPGLHASVLSLPGMPLDPRPVDQIVAEAFASPPAA